MGGQGTAPLATSLLGLGGNIAGVATKRPGLGQPLTQFSNQLAEQEQNAASQALQQQRLLQQQAQQDFYRQQSEKAMGLNEARFANTLQQQEEARALQQKQLGLSEQANERAKKAETRAVESHELATAKAKYELGEKEAQKKQAQDFLAIGQNLPANEKLKFNAFVAKGDYDSANRVATKANIFEPIDNALKSGQITPDGIDDFISSTYEKNHQAGMKALAKQRYYEPTQWYAPRGPVKKEFLPQPKQLKYNPATGKVE